MTAQDAWISLKKIALAAEANNPRLARALEDELYMDVLHAIAEGMPMLQAKELALVALESKHIQFDRWCTQG